MKVHIDIETRSFCDLNKCGVYVYRDHPSTEILVVCWAIENLPVATWYPRREPMPLDLELLLDTPDVEWCAHNANFERTILAGAPGQRIGFPSRLANLAQWDCTAARAACWGLPRSLDGAAVALGLHTQKDRDGYRLMLRMCKPLPVNQRARGLWLEDDVSLERLGAYCAQDVETERAIDSTILPLPAIERPVWELTERGNDAGVPVDDVLMANVLDLIERAEIDVNARLARLTNRQVQRVTDHGAITRWLRGFDADDSELAGLGDDGVGKAALAAMLERDDLPDLVREVLLLRQNAGKSSAAKYGSVLRRMSSDGRIRGVKVYCGAASTGRWSSRGAQTDNLVRSNLILKLAKRDKMSPGRVVDAIVRDLQAGATLEQITEAYGPPMVIASELLRPMFRARGGRLLARSDSSQIEARVLPWLAGATWKLDAFRAYDAGTGPDLYKIGAAGIFQTTPERVEDTQRQVGKVSELSLGFQGGSNALQKMCKGYGVKIPHYEHPKDVPFDQRPPSPTGSDEWIKERWREANPEIVASWRAANDAAIECMSSAPGGKFHVGERLYFCRNGKVLWLRLPSGRAITYWRPSLVENETPWGKRQPAVRYWAEDAQTHNWRPNAAYGGLWMQNATQATARDCMAFWLIEMDRAGYLPIMSVHDEGLAETADPDAVDRLTTIMRTPPPWALGLPVNTEASAGERYLK